MNRISKIPDKLIPRLKNFVVIKVYFFKVNTDILFKMALLQLKLMFFNLISTNKPSKSL